MKYQRPFLKWVGGKHRLLDKLNRKLPKGECLVEPFVGSGAVFMGTNYNNYLLADSNPDLIDLYRLLRDEGEWFIDFAKGLFGFLDNTAESYYSTRDMFNLEVGIDADMYRRAAYFIWLNRHGYNGLCRYNGRGEFNVPYGRYKSVHFPEQELLAFAQKLREREVTLRCGCFTETMLETRRGYVVYCDPPYAPLVIENGGFVYYTPGKFNWLEQQQLAAMAETLAQNGIPVVISNHSERSINKLYRESGASLQFINAPRSISCKADGRKPAREVLAYWRAVA